MKAFHVFCVVMLVISGIVFTSCTTTNRYVASSDDIKKFDKKERWQHRKHLSDEAANLR